MKYPSLFPSYTCSISHSLTKTLARCLAIKNHINLARDFHHLYIKDKRNLVWAYQRDKHLLAARIKKDYAAQLNHTLDQAT